MPDTTTVMWEWHRLVACGKPRLVWGLVALLLLFTSSALGQSELPNLLGQLQLSSYAARMWPHPFKGHTTSGQEVALDDLRGRVVLVTFWASWCAECRPEMPLFERLHRDYAAHGLTLVGINLRESVQTIERYAKALSLTFPLLQDPDGKITSSYGVIGLPTTFLIGRDGRPVALAVGPRAWNSAPARALIQTLLAEPATPRDKR
jgi:cytochrome c biogenesis protein CcmG/thiol:disulfide interchange protein DsbE